MTQATRYLELLLHRHRFSQIPKLIHIRHLCRVGRVWGTSCHRRSAVPDTLESLGGRRKGRTHHPGSQESDPRDSCQAYPVGVARQGMAVDFGWLGKVICMTLRSSYLNEPKVCRIWAPISVAGGTKNSKPVIGLLQIVS